MKFLIALFLVGVSFGAPQQNFRELERREPIRILRSEVSPIEGANFRYNYETENGIQVEKQGTEGSQGQSNMAGYYIFTFDDGTRAEVRYVADENGYRAESPLIPTPHPLPAHALEQIRIAEEQRARGIRWDEQGFQI
ncbi:Cuticle protein, partial [Armadillidium nasatum]